MDRANPGRERKTGKVYYLNNPAVWGLTLPPTFGDWQHCGLTGQGATYIWPTEFSPSALTPSNFQNLIDKFPLQDICILDRISGPEIVTIIGHVNRSGLNVLRGRTPFNNKPQFPDMSGIYRPAAGYAEAIVHTVGPGNLGSISDEPDNLQSEIAGIVSPLWHYLGLRVTAFGIPATRAGNYLLTL